MFGIDRRTLARVALTIGLVVSSAAGWAQQDDPPGRVGRLAQVQGRVWIYDMEQGQWVEGQRNQALSSGDRLSTERGAYADVRVGSTELRLDGNTELEFERIDDERMSFRLANGSLALRVRSREIAREVEVLSGEVRLLPERSGHYRIDREDDVTYASAWRGALRVDTRDQQVQVPAGRRAEFYRDSRGAAMAVSWSEPVNDAFSDWVARDEQRDERTASQRYVSPEMTGVEDLDRYGRWDRHPEYGMVWFPMQVAVDWAPYRHGRWTWHVRWGWTWVDEAPWGFAPFHYGRWVHWGGRWGWSPGAYVARPVFAPALVAWVGGPQVGFSVTIGGRVGSAVGWVPLAPRDLYVPPYRYGPRYYERVNQPHRNYHPPQVPTGPIMYGNQGVPSAVTVVPANVLTQRQPVAAAVMRGQEVQQAVQRERFRPQTPGPAHTAPPRVVAVPGGAEPARIPPAPGRDAAAPPRVIDLRRERAGPNAPAPTTAPPHGPAQGPVRPQAQPPAPAGPPTPVQRAPAAPPPAVVAPPAPPADGRGGRDWREGRSDRDAREAQQERDDRQPRTPESRQNQRERQNQQ